MGIMGTGFRIFLVDDDNFLHRLSMARYERLLRHEPAERLKEYAGKHVRCAKVVLEVAGRNPLSISYIEYFLLPLDAEGRIDITEQEKEAHLAVEVLPFITEEQSSGQVIDARSHFAKKRYEHEFKWTPTPEIQAAIVAAIFEKEPA